MNSILPLINKIIVKSLIEICKSIKFNVVNTDIPLL